MFNFDKEALERKFNLLQVTAGKRAEMYTLLASFTADGIPANEAISAMHREMSKEKDPRAYVTGLVLDRLRGGGEKASFTIGQALSGLVPSMEAVTIEAGETSSDLSGGFTRAAALARNGSRIRGVVIGSLAYPVVLFAIVGAILWMMKVKFVPIMVARTPIDAWPASAQKLAWVAENSAYLYGGFILFMTFVLTAFSLSKEGWIGETRVKFDTYVFPWTMQRRVSAASVLSAMASLMKMGVPLSQALDQMDKASSEWESWHFAKIRDRMRIGQREGSAIAADLFDKSDAWQIVLYGGLTNLASGMESISKEIMERVIKRVESAFEVIRYLMMAMVGFLIVWVYGSFMSVTLAGRAAG